MSCYTPTELSKIIRGYQKLDGLTDLLKEAARCRNCHKAHPRRQDLPLNALVRPIPALKTDEEVRKYLIGIRRDDTFLRNLLTTANTSHDAANSLKGARFAIGLLPWLDRCMLFRRTKKTKLMVVGIDYKHFPVFFEQGEDHCFPLDSYRTKNNIWGPSWRRFWSGLWGLYDDDTVNAFIQKHGVYFINSMLCFGERGPERPPTAVRRVLPSLHRTSIRDREARGGRVVRRRRCLERCDHPPTGGQRAQPGASDPGGITSPATRNGKHGWDGHGAGRDRCGDAGPPDEVLAVVPTGETAPSRV